MSTPEGQISCEKLIVAMNRFMVNCGVKPNRSFSLTLTANMTRPVTAKKDGAIGRTESWGFLSAQSTDLNAQLTQNQTNSEFLSKTSQPQF